MTKVALVTDSTAYIPDEIAQQYNLRIIPQVLIWGDQTLRDGVDITPTQFYERLATSTTMPSTSQASPAIFDQTFRELLDAGYEVLTVTLASRLSGTMASALQAKENFPGAPIEIVNSDTTSMAMGFQVLEAARLADKGGSLAECKQLVEKARQNCGLFVTLETLEFLHRGGRIGGAQRFLGTALNIKPILELRDGRLEPIERVRTRSKAIARLVELVEQCVGGRTPVHLATLHANAEQDARDLLDQIDHRIKIVEKVVAHVSPVVGTHVGPGTVGLTFLAGM